MNEQDTFLISPELEAFLDDEENPWASRGSEELELLSRYSASMTIWDKEPVKFRLVVQIHDSHPQAAQMMNLRSGTDLEEIDESALWWHYKNGFGYVWAYLDESLDGPLEFSVSHGTTLIRTDNDIFSDQVDEVWDDAIAFRDYLRNNINRIYAAVERTTE